MEAFNDAVRKAALAGEAPRQGFDLAHVAGVPIQLQQRLPAGAAAQAAQAGHIDADGYFRIGHIPAGTPVNLLANLNPDMSSSGLRRRSASKIKKALLEIKLENLDAAAAKEVMKRDVAPELLKVSKCPDLVEDRGHDFGTSCPTPTNAR